MQHSLEFVEPGFALGAFGLVNMTIWTQLPKPDHLRKSQTLALRLVGENPGKQIVSFTFLNTQAGLPDAETQQVSAETIKAVAPYIATSVCVIDGTGVFAMAARAAVQGIHLVARTAYPQRTFSNIEDAAGYIAIALQYDVEQAAGLIAAVRTLKTISSR